MENVKIGYARRDITPDGQVQINSVLVSTKTETPLCVTALSVQSGDTRALVVSFDIREITRSFRAVMQPRIAEATGLTEAQVLLTCTHNHSTPDASYITKDNIMDWRERICTPAALEAAKAAIADEKAVTAIAGGTTELENTTYVRRYQRADGTWYCIASANPSKAPLVAHESKADPELRTVRICREGGEDIILVNYQVHAAHALSLAPTVICADFVHPLRERLEEATGAKVLYIQGCCGNLNSFTRLEEEKPFAKATYWDLGYAIADAALEAMKKEAMLQPGDVRLQVGTLRCAVNHTKDHLADTARELYNVADPKERTEKLHAAGIANRYEQAQIIRRVEWPEMQGEFHDMPLAALSFGDVAICFFPLEMFDVLGVRLRIGSAFPMTLTCGYSLDYYSYLPDSSAFPHGEYEVTQCHYVAGTGEHIVLKLLGWLQEMRK
ncbi:MAG: hypothetical protein IKU07_02085 [Oscillospiraceae bacterium]|nr:hypothetical protein [Oscillospiraceae bacterium]